MNKQMQEGDLFLCTVERIEPTVVFVKLPNGKEGTIVSSEIAPGRIKNIREYVAPNKKIVCKILNIRENHLALSLRRVTSKEKQEILKQFQQEQTIKSALKQILGKDAESSQKNILQDFPSLADFFENARQDNQIIIKYIPKEFEEQFKKVIEKKKKQVELKQLISLKCIEDNGIKRIKSLLSFKEENITITYISAGNFQIKIIAENYKEANQKIKSILEEIEKKAKENQCEFEIKEGKK